MEERDSREHSSSFGYNSAADDFFSPREKDVVEGPFPKSSIKASYEFALN